MLGKDGRIFVPSHIADNPSLSEDEYRHSLLHLPPLARERLMQGDWSVQEQGIFPANWLRYYIETPAHRRHLAPRDANDSPCASSSALEHALPLAERAAYDVQLELLDAAGRLLAVVPEHACRRFVTIDPAGTSADKVRESRGRPASWTVVQVWDQPPRELSRFLLLREQVREQVAFDGLVSIVKAIHARWRPQRIWIEDEKLGQAAVSILQRERLPIEVIRTHGRDKLARASELILKMQRGEIFLPRHDNRWRPAFEAELLAWTGHEDQPSDQIDAAAYAAIIASQHNPSPLRLQRIVHRS
jgi:phage terminase large subunit-like protein